MTIRIATAALTRRIYAGKLNKAGNAFLAGKVDVTSDVLKAIIDKIGAGNTEVVTENGVPAYEITVTAVGEQEGGMRSTGECISCGIELCAIDDDPNGDGNVTCARCRAEESHDFDAEPGAVFNRRGGREEPIVKTEGPPQFLTIGPFTITRTPGKLHIRCGEGEGGEFAEADLEAALAAFWGEKF